MNVYATCDSPIGALTLMRDADGLTMLWMGERSVDAPRDDEAFADVVEQLSAYFSGGLREFTLPLAARGTPFQRRVWDALREIPYGETASYAEVAAAIGRPGAARAVGHANARNPIGIIVPCHRVIGSSGALTGYAHGLDTKRVLLDLERRAVPV